MALGFAQTGFLLLFEVFWTGLKDKCEDTIRQCTFEIEIQRHILELAEKRIALEKEKLK